MSAWSLPLVASDPSWQTVAFADLDSVMRDHLHCERKAALSALSLARSYPQRTDIGLELARLAHEETRHVVQVTKLLAQRNVEPSFDESDDYAAALGKHVNKREPQRLLDRLLVFAIIEGRSAERLGIIATTLAQDVDADPSMRRLYRVFAEAENRHCALFMQLAAATDSDWRTRAIQLCAHEAAILASRPITARIH